MGRLAKRVSDLERAFPMWKPPEEDEERRRVFEEALSRITLVELAVLCEVLELRVEHPDASNVEFWHMMSDTQRTMESEWRKITRQISRNQDVDSERQQEVVRRNEKGPYARP